MTFEEILTNLLGARSKWFLDFTTNDGKGAIAVKGGKIIFAELEYEGSLLEGTEAVRKMLEISKEIEDIELHPLNGTIQENTEINQFELLSMLQVTDENDEENQITVEFEEKPKEGELLKLCKHYFSADAIKIVIVDDKVKVNSSVATKENLKNLMKDFSDIENLKSKCISIDFRNYFVLILTSSSHKLMIVLDEKEKANFELEEPEIVENLLKVLDNLEN